MVDLATEAKQNGQKIERLEITQQFISPRAMVMKFKPALGPIFGPTPKILRLRLDLHRREVPDGHR